MRRRWLNLVVATSMVLCLATCALWVRSIYRVDYLGFHDARYRSIDLRSGHGSVGFGVDHRIRRPLSLKLSATPISGQRRPLGSFHLSYGYFGIIILVPYWFVVVPISIIPLRWLTLTLRIRRRIGAGLCPACGYDVRATPDRCPECGTVIPSPPAAGATA